MERIPHINADGKVVAKDGQVLDPSQYRLVVVPIHPRKMKEKDWFMMYQAGLIKLAKDKEVRGVTRSVLDIMMSMMDFENDIGIDQGYIAKELGVDKAVVSRSIKLLVDKKILRKGIKVGRMNTYNLNDFYAWKGTVEKKREASVRDITSARRHQKPK